MAVTQEQINRFTAIASCGEKGRDDSRGLRSSGEHDAPRNDETPGAEHRLDARQSKVVTMKPMKKFLLVLAMVAGLTPVLRADERGRLKSWATAALLRESPAQMKRPCIELLRQDHGQLQIDKSVLGTPLQIGAEKFARGLGTHATSQIVVHSDRPMKKFEAKVGVDNNFDTAGVRGSVVFAIEANGKELFRSKLCKGGEAPDAVSLDLHGAKDLTLRVTDGGDGFNYDQADWCDPTIMLDDGRRVTIESLPNTDLNDPLGPNFPVSFIYAGKTSAELLPKWKIEHSESKGIRSVSYVDPETALRVQTDVRIFDDLDAVEWVARLTNTGSKDTPLIEQLSPLATSVASSTKDVVFHHSLGSTSSATDFLPIDDPLPPRAHITLAPNGGRSSDGQLPFFNFEFPGKGGIVLAIGWSGEWQLDVDRDPAQTLRIRAAQQTTHFILHPGESVRTPRILIGRYEGDATAGSNLIRRALIAHYLPRAKGELVTPPTAESNWPDNQGNDSNEKNQLNLIEQSSKAGIEAYWLDAGWFLGGWPNGVGTWDERKDAFPRGLKALSDAAHAKNQKFILWFEPERVHAGSKIDREHSDFVFPKQGADGLFNLADPTARKWLTDLLDSKIKAYGIDVYRNDFNIDPQRFWAAADAKDRQGITENHYIEGLYAMWDELLARNPGMWIDNCASGGRRIDLETLSRSIPLWRSDTECFEGHDNWSQAQIAGLSTYVPFHTAGMWKLDPYSIRSVATAGGAVFATIQTSDLPMLSRAIDEIKRDRAYWSGDFYPLTAVNVDPSHWCGWQLHRADHDDGMLQLFRREQSPYPQIAVHLHGIDPAAQYTVTLAESYDANDSRTITGKDLADLHVTLQKPRSCVRIRYAKQ
jgi:alpha-galactosidase